MKSIFTTIYYLTIGVVGLLGLMLISTLVPIPGNFEAKVVKSGSMEPTIRVGSIVVIKPAATYKVGDIVTFGADTKTQIPTTHRIVAMEGQGSTATFQTKGDANDSPDQTTVRLSDIHGKMVLTIPYLGYILAFARTQIGFMILVGLPALLVFLEEGKNIILEIKRIRRGRMVKAMPIPMKPQLARQELPHNPITHRIKVMGLILALGLLTAGTTGSGLRGDTIAYYADQTISQGNKLAAAAVYPNNVAQDLAVTFSATALVLGESTETPEDVPPPEPFVVEISEPVVVENPPAEAPDPPPAEVPPVEVPPVETPAQ